MNIKLEYEISSSRLQGTNSMKITLVLFIFYILIIESGCHDSKKTVKSILISYSGSRDRPIPDIILSKDTLAKVPYSCLNILVGKTSLETIDSFINLLIEDTIKRDRKGIECKVFKITTNYVENNFSSSKLIGYYESMKLLEFIVVDFEKSKLDSNSINKVIYVKERVTNDF